MPLRFFTDRSVGAMLRDAADAKHLDDDERAAAVLEAMRVLADMPQRARVRALRKLDVQDVAASLGSTAVPLLRALLDDDATRPVVGAATIGAWLQIDAMDCATYALARLEDW